MVADRFLAPVARAMGSVMIIPAMPDAVDAAQVALRCDALLMTGSCSNVSPARYGGSPGVHDRDDGRDEVAMRVADAMIEAGRPVLGVCRGMQELNVLFGGTLADLSDGVHMDGTDWRDPRVFAHRHDVVLEGAGRLRGRSSSDVVSIFSAHRQGVRRLGAGLVVEARAGDGLVEAFSASPRGTVVGVQWHPELGRDPFDRSLFEDLVKAA